jgi:hypothetical protein
VTLASRTAIGQLLASVGLLAVAGATLIPLPQQTAASASTSLWCLVCGEYGGVDVLNNILLFLPLGLGIRLSGFRVMRVVAFGALLSLVIELLQFAIIPGRDASLSDVVTNTLGTWVGAMAGTHLVRLLLPSSGQAAVLALAAALAWLTVQAATAVLLRPWASDEIRGGAWARATPGRTPFDGRVTAAVVSGFPIGNAPQPVSGLAAKVRQGDVHLEVRLLSGSHAAVWSPVFEVLKPGGSVMSLEAVGRHLAFQPPMRSSQLRLRRPALRLDGALPSTPGVPLRVLAGVDGDSLVASWSIAESHVFRSDQVLGPSLGWSLITPVRHAFGPETLWITGMWIAGWFGVIAYWTVAWRARLLAIASALTLVLFIGLALIPRLFGYPVSHWTEWLAGTAGGAIGYAGYHFAAYLGERCDSLSIKESC